MGRRSLTVLDYALGYGRLGWRVFPVWPGEKRPIYAGWPADATVEPELIQRYFRKDPFPNIGIVCGEAFDAWDVEAEHLPALTAHMEANGLTLPEGPLASTGRGGMHLLTKPTGTDHTRQLHLAGTHIGELKSRGGFIVVAPSVTVAAYRWLWAPGNMELTELEPDHWLRGLLERPATVTRKFKDRLTSPEDVVALLGQLGGAVTHAGTGARNNYLYWAMRRALEEGVPPRQAGNVLMAAGADAGLEPHEIQATIRSAYAAEGIAA